MDRKKFLEFVKHPENLGFEEAGILEDLSEEYPYCQAIVALQLIQAYQVLPNVYTQLLPEAGIKTAERANLRHILHTFGEKKNKNNPS